MRFGLDLLANLLNVLHILNGALHDLMFSRKPLTQLHSLVNENYVLIIHVLLNFQNVGWSLCAVGQWRTSYTTVCVGLRSSF